MAQPVKKIVIIGPESTGKSTVAKALAQHFDTVFVPEFAREYIDALGRPYVYEDLWEIARGQLALEEQKAEEARNGLLFCDTDLYVLKVWSEHKYGRCDERILRAIGRRQYDDYLLTDIDLPWVADPQREHPEPEMRQYFFKVYKEIVINSGLPWACLQGNEQERLRQAAAVLKDHAVKA
ncbi:MAG TPA: ATP-binding protein [Edaphocola sp.]|nr:ATP-binding protein [Edaphocola sp.]